MVIENVYNFNTISTVLLAGTYKNMKLVADMGFKQAVRYSGVYSDVITIRQQLVLETNIVLLPAETVRYFLFEDNIGNEVLLASDWITSSSIVVVTSVTGVFKVSNITTADISTINNMISALGYKSLDTTIINT